jgi:hypothetical protein
VVPPGSETSKRQTRKFCWTRTYLIEDKRTGNSYRNSSRKKTFNEPYENTANCQSLLRHTRVDFFRPTATAASSWHVASQSSAGTSQRPGHRDQSGCPRAFASSRYDARHSRNAARDDNRERFSDSGGQRIARCESCDAGKRIR